MRFEVGRVYRRADLHADYGGQPQGGTITPKDHPVVFLITGESGRVYGYADEQDEAGIWRYFGHGREGDMKFERGNAAIRDHASNEEELHLFEALSRPGYLRYIGEMACSGYEIVDAPDVNGRIRKAIVFHLVPVGDEDPIGIEGGEPVGPGLSLDEANAKADADPTEESDPREGKRKTHARSRHLKLAVRLRAAGHCEGCGQPAPFIAKDGIPYLEPHHTRRRSDHGPGNRRTVIALCPNCHARVEYSPDGPAYNEELQAKLEALTAASE